MEINLLLHNYHDLLLTTPQLHAELKSSLVLAKEALQQSLQAVLAKDELRKA